MIVSGISSDCWRIGRRARFQVLFFLCITYLDNAAEDGIPDRLANVPILISHYDVYLCSYVQSYLVGRKIELQSGALLTLDKSPTIEHTLIMLIRNL